MILPTHGDGGVDALFAAGVGTREKSLDTIRHYHEEHHYLQRDVFKCQATPRFATRRLHRLST